MTIAGVAPDALTELEHRMQLRRAVIASTIGTTIEWYDFFLYSTVTGLVFAKLYFPESDPLVGTLQAFAIYAVGFVARPVGAAIFGHYGDRLGRKAALIATLLLMGIATFLIAFVPTYAQIGIWGAVILTILRFVQGVGGGGEWGGSVLMSMEWARSDHHRGFIAVWPQLRRTGRAVSGEFGGARVQPDLWKSVPRLGMANSVFPQHPPRRRRPLYSARDSRDADLFASRRGKSGREGPGHRSHKTATQGDLVDGVGADGRTGAILHFYSLHFHLWDDNPRGLAQSAADGSSHGLCRVVLPVICWTGSAADACISSGPR